MNSSEKIRGMRDLYDACMRKNSWVLAFSAHLERDVSRYVAHNGETALLMWHQFGAEPAALEARIQTELAWFRGRSKLLYWKVYGHDQPPGLGDRLAQLGADAEDNAVLHMASVAEVCERLAFETQSQRLQSGSSRADVMRAQAVWVDVWPESADEQRIWGELYAGALDKLTDSPQSEQGARFWTAGSDADAGIANAAGYLIHAPNSPVALLCGGAVRKAARNQGLYKALLKARAEWAQSRGAKWLAIEASPMSAPIVQSLGFVPITSLVFYKFKLS